MTVFQQFQNLVETFRIAGEINGGIWVWLEVQLGLTGRPRKRADIGLRSAEVLLRRLRGVFNQPEKDELRFCDMAGELLAESETWPPPSRRGPPFRWLPCPWFKCDRVSCDGTLLDGHRREEFRTGELARVELLIFIDIERLAHEQVKKMSKVRGLFWSTEEIKQRARETEAHWRFEDGCYARATFGFLHTLVGELRQRNADESTISQEAIRKGAWALCPAGDGMTLYGRFGGIIRDTLQEMRKERTLRLVDDPADNETPTPDGTLLDEIRQVIQEYPEPKRKTLYAIVESIANGAPRREALHEAAAIFGESPAKIDYLWRSFQGRMTGGHTR